MTIARFFFAISGLDTGSPFTAIGASREAMLGVLVEPILLLGLWVAAQVAGSTHISSITDTIYHWPVARTLPLILALCACAFATFIEMGKLPFDLAEAEQELQEGPLSEYSGSGFGVLKWGISLKQLVVLQMFVGVFIAGDCAVRKQHGASALLRHLPRHLGRVWFCLFSLRLLAGGVI
ncbi:MAG: NADH-quinone oxidoreductase subunit H [Klebsiella michiganensis]|nr:NADH-quinone oxidoreductase subunit H [Klebsiella michiganensis]